MEEKNSTENVANEQVYQSPNANDIEAFAAELEATTEPQEQVEQSPEPVVEDVKDTETQDVEDSSPSESPEVEEPTEDTVDEEEEEEEEVINVTEEDIDNLFKEKKSRVQQRIDKLTAEKKSVKEHSEAVERQNIELLARIEQLESSMQTKNDTKAKNRPTEYTREQLETAITKSFDDNDMQLYHEANKQLRALDIWEAKQEAMSKQTADSQFKQQENQVWRELVNEYKGSGDKDLDIGNQGSLMYKLIAKMFNDQETSSRLNKYGVHRFTQAANEAHRLILEARLKSKKLKTTKSLEKKLAKEKRKNSLSSGGPGIDESIKAKPKQKDDSSTAAIDEMMAANRQLRGFK